MNQGLIRNLLDLTQGVCYRLWSFHAFWPAIYGGLEGILLVGIRAAFPCGIVLRVISERFVQDRHNSFMPFHLLLGWLSHFSNCKKSLVMIRLLCNPLSAALPAVWKKECRPRPRSVYDAWRRADRRRSEAGTTDYGTNQGQPEQ